MPRTTAAGNPLSQGCGQHPAIACRLTWDISHSQRAADVTRVYLAGPIHLALRVALVLLVALLLRAGAQRLIRRITARAVTAGDAPSDRGRRGGRERRQQRASALASLLGNAASVTIFSIAAVMVLGDIGLNLAPILASAGVLGIAIGFGAQNLVRDFLAGIFMLLEDQYGVGDVINASGVSGTVEGVSLRITRLRDINGVIWHIRNGTIKKAGNESHGWARAVVDVPVPVDHAAGAARALMDRIATAMWREPGWHDVILEQPEVWGIQELTADSMLMRVSARTAPLRQWEVARELRQRLKESLLIPAVSAAGGQVTPPAAETVPRQGAGRSTEAASRDTEPAGRDTEPADRASHPAAPARGSARRSRAKRPRS